MPRRPRLSPGRLTALWVILRTLSKFGGTAHPNSLRTLAARSALRSGALPIEDGYELGVSGRFLVEREELTTTLGPFGAEALNLCDEDEPSREVLRLFVSVLVLGDPPPWVAYWQGDPSSLDLVLPEQERRLLEHAELLPIPDQQDFTGWIWWSALSRVPLPEEAGAFRKAIGDAGEELSIEHERRRLDSEGFPDLARLVRWVGRESPAYGFDIASFWGKAPTGRGNNTSEPQRPLAIEVKSTFALVGPKFPIYVSHHEWDMAQGLRDSYLFHLWDGVNPRPELKSRRSQPLVVTIQEIERHVPNSATCGEACRWQSSYIELPMDSKENRVT